MVPLEQTAQVMPALERLGEPRFSPSRRAIRLSTARFGSHVTSRFWNGSGVTV